MTEAWEPCADCKRRLDEYARDLSKQGHDKGLTAPELVRELKDIPLRGNWSRQTRYQCELCGLHWLHIETQLGALYQYESSFAPQPTEEQKLALSN